ncbi:neutral/alkaline non-lysosomal ceramidase N-terminal domain-containing protein [Pontibacter arcticus]|uniref:Neutral ceramidase n=1 Tax=Pontibacter arcticus TaxID=2080288 RepID=A0A364RC57_9BACT|nr:neutral/alkaline non-lysosomal ceramidase N-terminal domain-containing protein [Pontibacter arcticus]RAU81746.1 hypothetical protein DP923_13670 [Pontibacter arcticus]
MRLSASFVLSILPKKVRNVLMLVLVACVAPSCVIQKPDETPFQQAAYYKNTSESINNSKPISITGDTLQVGWAKVNITPPAGTPLAGYGKRLGMKYKTVHDSVWVRTFAFDNGQSKAVLITLDMLIAPMSVAAGLETEYEKLDLKPDQVYLTATHTHTSFGGWGKKPAGRVMAGKYKKAVVKQTVQHIIQSIKLAQVRQQPARVGYGTANGAALIQNRLTGSVTERDTTIRFMKFEQAGGASAILTTFSAHPTILPSMQPILSRDYPGVLVDELEKNVNFAAFAAGAVGSHNTVYKYGDTFRSVTETGTQLAKIILREANQLKTAYTSELSTHKIELALPEPHWRLGDNKRLAPGLFYAVFGKYKAHLNHLQIGNTVLLGVPADYSGEFMAELETAAKSNGKNVLVTGFNGSYIGYIIPEKHYQLRKYEARDMNFYGRQSGTYITQLLLQLLY